MKEKFRSPKRPYLAYVLAAAATVGALTVRDIKVQPGDFPASTPQITATSRFGGDYRLSDYGFGPVVKGACKDGQQKTEVYLIWARPPYLPESDQSNPKGYPPRQERC